MFFPLDFCQFTVFGVLQASYVAISSDIPFDWDDEALQFLTIERFILMVADVVFVVIRVADVDMRGFADFELLYFVFERLNVYFFVVVKAVQFEGFEGFFLLLD